MTTCPEDEVLHSAAANSKDVDVGSLELLPPGSTIRVEAPDSDLALANVGGTISALVGPCLRCGSPLAAAALTQDVLTCLHCGWQYDLHDGGVVGLPALRLRRHAVRVESGRMFVSADLFDTTPRSV